MIIEKDGYWFRVEKVDYEKEHCEVSGVTPVCGSEGTIYNPRTTDVTNISFLEVKKYTVHDSSI